MSTSSRLAPTNSSKATHDAFSSILVLAELPMSTTQHEYYKYYNNGKTNPDNLVLYLYTTYDTKSFHPISIISCPMIPVHPRGFHNLYGIEITTLVKLQILEAGRIF